MTTTMPHRPIGLAEAARLQHVAAAIDAVKNGKMVILVDDEDRENEGDLVLAAERTSPESINFMATHARGLVCLSQNESLVVRARDVPVRLDRSTGAWRAVVFEVPVEKRQFLALVLGDLSRDGDAPLCRVHSGSTFGDVFGSTPSEGGSNLRAARKM